MSSERRPKQFLSLVTERTLLQETLSRTRQLAGEIRAPVIVCNESHLSAVVDQAREIGVQPQAIVLEPVARNTAPAAAVAALIAQALEADRHGTGSVSAEGIVAADTERLGAAGRGTLLLVLPADHVVLDPAAFVVAVGAAVDAASHGYLTTFGVVPESPETGFGYILRGEEHGAWAIVEKFVEKPALEVAESYVRSGRYLWNSGVFLFSVDALLRALAVHAGDVLAACERAVADARSEANIVRLGAAFADCPSISIDVAVMERTERAAVVTLDAGWSDVGSWSALHAVLPKDKAGNVLVGEVVADSCKDSYIAASSRVVAAIGLEGIVVVETADAVLVMSHDKAQSLKRVVEALKARRGAADGRFNSEGDTKPAGD